MSRLPLSCPRMRKPTLLLLAALVAAPLFAQEDDEKTPSQPVENLYFNTDEYIAIPKFTFSYGYRLLNGSKASFGGNGLVYNANATAFSIDPTSTTEARIYDDGYVYADTRSDAGGRPMPSDGQTTSWLYQHDSQIVDGFVNFHTYSAQVLDSGGTQRSMGNTYGMEVTVARDLPKLSRRILWNVSGGVSLNDIRDQMLIEEAAVITTNTDSYWLQGQAAPTAGTSNPTSGSVAVTQPDGTTTAYTETNTITTTLPNTPDGTVTGVTSEGTVSNHYKIKGSYFTLRMGPTFIIPFNAKFRVSLGAGLALIYAGTQYTIDSEFTPTEEESTISRTESSYEKHALPGYYLDANLEYWITERTGLYAGAIFQFSGDYEQKLNPDEEMDYSSRVDLSTQSGFRLGMNHRF